MRIGVLALVVNVAGMASPAAAQPPAIGIGSTRIVEGHSGTRNAQVTVSLSAPATSPVSVAYATTDGTAGGGTDYLPARGTLTFAVGEITKAVTVGITGDTAIEPDESFEVTLANPKGAALGTSTATATATIVNDDFPTARGLAVYEVRVSFVGHTGSFAGADCPGVRRNGTAVLTGLIAGDESGAANDDKDYDGLLQLETDLDLCEVTRKPGSDEDFFCVITVVGSASVPAELRLNVDNRGAYLKTGTAAGAPMASASGNCGATANADERAQFPDNSYANPFDGIELDQPSGTLRVGRYTNGDVTFEVLRVVRP
jgi:Calx-beta domain